MNPSRVDLNLLGIFNAILETGSVTAAANRYGITQPAMSNALARLRRVFDDPLFVPMASGMRPTPFALEIAGTVNRGLHAFEEAFEHHKRFDPLQSRRVFRFHMTDMAQMIFLPRILTRLRVRMRARWMRSRSDRRSKKVSSTSRWADCRGCAAAGCGTCGCFAITMKC